MAFPCNIVRWFYVVYILVREDHRIRLGQGRYSLCNWICSQYFHILLEIYQPIRGQEIMELDKILSRLYTITHICLKKLWFDPLDSMVQQFLIFIDFSQCFSSENRVPFIEYIHIFLLFTTNHISGNKRDFDAFEYWNIQNIGWFTVNWLREVKKLGFIVSLV